MKSYNNLILIEHYGNEKIFVDKFKSCEDVVKYINKTYDMNTTAEDLKECLDLHFTAWLYMRFFEISVEIGEE